MEVREEEGHGVRRLIQVSRVRGFWFRIFSHMQAMIFAEGGSGTLWPGGARMAKKAWGEFF